MSCVNHPDIEQTVSCARCRQQFCDSCVIEFQGSTMCGACKNEAVREMEQGTASNSRMQYAGFLLRFGCVFLDGIIQRLVGVLIAVVVGVISAGPEGGIFAAILSLLFNVFYEVIMVYKFSATLGKMAGKVKVVRPDGSPVSFGQALGRPFAKIVSAIFLMVGYIVAAFDDEGRTWHDRMCGTRVIKQ